MTRKQSPDIHTLVRSALAHHPVRVIARALGVSPATVSALALPKDVCPCQAGSIALAEKNADALAALLAA